MPKTVIMIPARMNSSRCPGKALACIGGAPALYYTHLFANTTNLPIWVVTPDKDIWETMFFKRGCNCVVVDREECSNGTERCAYAAIKLGLNDNDIVINVQGDMVFFDPSVIPDMVKQLSTHKELFLSTCICPIKEKILLTNKNKVKCIISFDGSFPFVRVLDFCREPFVSCSNYLHVGIYGYTVGALKQYLELETYDEDREKTESLEQLRIVKHKKFIGAIATNIFPIVIDTKEDLDYAEKELKRMVDSEQWARIIKDAKKETGISRDKPR